MRRLLLASAVVWSTLSRTCVGLSQLRILALHHDLVANDTNILRCSLGTWHHVTVLLILKGSASTLKPVDIAVLEAILNVTHRVQGNSWSHWSTHLVVSQSLTDIFVAAEGDISSDSGLILIETSSLRRDQLLMVLLLCEVELIDTAMTVL